MIYCVMYVQSLLTFVDECMEHQDMVQDHTYNQNMAFISKSHKNEYGEEK